MSAASRTLAGRHAVVIGSGVSGLGAALELSERGARVTILERDEAPPAADSDVVFREWRRSGAPHVRHSHVFLGRLRNHLRDHHPGLLAALMAAGARELKGTERPPLALRGLPPEPGDADIVAIGCRRITFERVLRAYVLRQPGVGLRSGLTVTGLLATRHETPIVSGIRYLEGEREKPMAAHFVVDASGRRSDAPEWLRAIDARPPYEVSESSGVVYYTRFYRLRPGVAEPPQTEHPVAADYDWIKYAIFPADDGVFSVTLAVPIAIQRLKILARVAAFDALVESIPALAPWVAGSTSEPVDDPLHPVQAMGGLINRLRRFVDDRGPIALRFFVLGDAAYCTNPLYGRGCTQALLHAYALAVALERSSGDPAAAAIELDRWGRATLEPFYRASILADRDAVRRAEGRAPRRLEARFRERFFRDGVAIAMRCDPVVYRAFLRMLNMLETPEEAFGKPEVVLRCLWVMVRSDDYKQRYPLPPLESCDRILARCEAALERAGQAAAGVQ